MSRVDPLLSTHLRRPCQAPERHGFAGENMRNADYEECQAVPGQPTHTFELRLFARQFQDTLHQNKAARFQ